MKKLIVVISILVAANAAAQTKLDEFAKQKKTSVLSTGISMKYVQAGDPNGIPVLLLHGFTDSSRSFQLMIDQLLKINKSFRVIAPDLRGHGGSSMPDEEQCSANPELCFSLDLFVADLIALLDNLKIPKVNVVGHSMGSVIAQGLATKHPDRLAHVVLIATFVNGEDVDGIQSFLIDGLLEKTWRPMLEKKPGFTWPTNAYAVTPATLGEEVKDFLRDNWVAEASADPEFVAAVLPETLATPLGTWIGALRMLAAADTREALRNLRTPTLILWPSQDAFMLAAGQEKVKSAFGNAVPGTRVIYKTYGKRPLPKPNEPFNEVGHNLHWAAPKEVAEDVNAFITKGYPVDNFSYASDEDVRKIVTVKANGNIMEIK